MPSRTPTSRSCWTSSRSCRQRSTIDEASEPKAENNADEEGAEEASQEEKKEESVNMDSIDAYISQKIELIRLGDKLHMDGIDAMKPMDAKKAIIKR